MNALPCLADRPIHHPAAAPTGAPAGPPEDDEPGGCGWFDSSHALLTGLRVTEHASADALADAVPLACWIQMHLAGWRSPVDGPAQ